TFPLFKILDLFMDMVCDSTSNYFDMAYATEVDSIWQDDLWSAMFTPESGLFANALSRLVCVADAVSTNFYYPIDQLFWCLGAAHIYPLSATNNATPADEDANMKALGRFLFRHHRIGALWETIGSGAYCSATYSPTLPKSQYRVDPVFPAPDSTSTPIPLGRKYLFWKGLPPHVSSYPTHE